MAPHTVAYYGVTQTKFTPVLPVVCILPDLSNYTILFHHNDTTQAVQLNAITA